MNKFNYINTFKAFITAGLVISTLALFYLTAYLHGYKTAAIEKHLNDYICKQTSIIIQVK